MRRPATAPGPEPVAAAPSRPDTGWNPELVETLYRLLYVVDLGNDGLHAELEQLEKRFGDILYAELIHLLSHLRYPPAEARAHWHAVVAHRDAMERRMGGTVDLRVALVSYFVEVNRQLKIPKIIELKVFEQTQASVYQDELTGLCNFRYFREHLAREMQRSERYGTPLSLVMIDIDNFKTYNDVNGHEAGNRALVTIAGLLAQSLRKIDVAARYGGEEFALILTSTSKTGASQVAERTRAKIEAHAFARGAPEASRLTVSLGVATYPADATGAVDLVRRADSALYVAKTRGKNQVHLYGENRRSHRRVDAALEGRFSLMAERYHPMTTVNLSEGGFLALTSRNLPVGALVQIQIRLPGSAREIEASGRVVRVAARPNGRYETAFRIVDIQSRDQSRLTKYLKDSSPAD